MSWALQRSIGELAMLAAASSATAQPPSPTIANACAIHVPEAASRSGLPADIILRVMMAESGGNSKIVSPKGAMGCMQIMPATWAYLSPRYNLGADPFSARSNMIAGAMYLAELVGRYGMPGALAAYNAGPGRYERYAAGTAALPAETIAYTARIGVGASVPIARTITARWQEASLFLARHAQSTPVDTPSRAAPDERSNVLFPLAGSHHNGTADPTGP